MTAFSAELERLRSAHGYSYASLARRASYSKAYVYELARGKRPSRDVAERLDAALGAGGALLALAFPPAPDLPLWTPAMTPEPGAPLGDTDLAAMRATLTSLIDLDTTLGSDGIVDVAQRAYRTAADRLALHGGGPDLRAAVADLGICASWIAGDAMQLDAARQISAEAMLHADLAGDARLRRFLLSQLSMLGEWSGRGGEALAYADRALAEDPTDPRVRAMFSVRRARALGKLGNPSAALDAWRHAERLLAAGPDDTTGLTYWLHDAEMAIHRAVIHTDAGQTEALEWAHRGITLLPPHQGRDAVLLRAMLLEQAARLGAWTDVETAAAQLLTAGPARSGRVPALLRTALASCRPAPARVRDAVRAALTALA